MVLQVKIPNIYYREDHQPDSGTGGIKCKTEDRVYKTLVKNNSFSSIINGSKLLGFQRSYLGNLFYMKQT